MPELSPAPAFGYIGYSTWHQEKKCPQRSHGRHGMHAVSRRNASFFRSRSRQSASHVSLLEVHDSRWCAIAAQPKAQWLDMGLGLYVWLTWLLVSLLENSWCSVIAQPRGPLLDVGGGVRLPVGQQLSCASGS